MLPVCVWVEMWGVILLGVQQILIHFQNSNLRVFSSCCFFYFFLCVCVCFCFVIPLQLAKASSSNPSQDTFSLCRPPSAFVRHTTGACRGQTIPPQLRAIENYYNCLIPSCYPHRFSGFCLKTLLSLQPLSLFFSFVVIKNCVDTKFSSSSYSFCWH